MCSGALRECRNGRPLRELSEGLVRQGRLPLSSLSFENLCSNADIRLFACIMQNPCHVLKKLLPPIKQSRKSLRPRSHNRELPMFYNLSQKCFRSEEHT